jgi:cellulose synthase/poly-beta-1,6-N-acetylglucosamine synthase-like glycosyltransferase
MMKISKYRRSQFAQFILSAFALACVGSFALWWFQPSHLPDNFPGVFRVADVLLFLLVSYIIWHPIIMDVLTWFISLHIKDIKQQKPPPGLKVAFITTIVPKNEPLDLLHKCLPAMVNAQYPHDTWLLDEGNNPEVKAICQQYGVMHFSRNGKHEYNTKKGKFTRTKGGNHNSWYDVYGNSYDIVAQIDTDFVPKSTFLTKTLGYFKDPNVAFVGTPQIYGNTKDSIIAQGAAEQQYCFYGSVLRGLSGMGMTLLIGANHVVRVAALKNVNHYSAHITEDLLTGMKMHTKNWKSIYVPHALAVGEAPSTWEAYFSQQMRWAYGCTDILLHHSPKLFKKMGLKRTLYYFFLQQHYFSGIAMGLSILLLSFYFIANIRTADVDLIQFFTFYATILLICWLMSLWLQRYNVFRPSEGELLLPGKIISVAAWPIWFLASVCVLFRKQLKYKVTPKGENDAPHKTPITVFIPHIIFGLIAVLGIISSFFTHRQNIVMEFWALSSAVLMLSVPFIVTFSRKGRAIYTYTTQWLQKKYTETNEKRLLTISVQPIITKNSKKLSRISRIKEAPQDAIFLGLVVAASCILYVSKIGFYSDDWSFLGNFSTAKDQSLIGLFKIASTPNTQMRPLQNIYDVLLYKIFGVHPLGYQLVNMGVLIAITILFYCILKRLKLPRIIAVAVPLVYALLPNYSADRFWYAAFQANLCILFFLISLYAGLRAFSQRTMRTSFWKIVSIFGLVLSSLSYEVAIPLVVLNMVFYWNPHEKLLQLPRKKTQHHHSVFLILTGVALIYIFLFKVLTTTRLADLHYPGYIAYIIGSAFTVNYGTFLLRLPYIWGEIISEYANPVVLASGFALYLVIFIYLYTLLSKPQAIFPRPSWMRNLTLSSFIIFFLGYAIFLTNNQVGFSPTGIENRVAIAGAVGVAFTFVGMFGWACRRFLPEKASRVLFSVLIAVVCASGFIIINTLASFWAQAYQQQQKILASIQTQFPIMPKNSTLILDGVCPYVGPAVVFESEWDLKGALQTIYHDPTLRADIVTPRLSVAKQGINTEIYTFPSQYPYKNLYIYNMSNKNVYPIPNAQTANAYFQKFNPDYNNNCPPGSAGNGVSVF